jgi:hypothetical protein
MLPKNSLKNAIITIVSGGDLFRHYAKTPAIPMIGDADRRPEGCPEKGQGEIGGAIVLPARPERAPASRQPYRSPAHW